MLIRKSRILNPKQYLQGIEENKDFYIGVIYNPNLDSILSEIGLSDTTLTSSFLPKVIGRITSFNLEGKEKIRKDLPKITKYRDSTIKDWRGDSHSVSIPYETYPRDHINAPLVKLKIITDSGNRILVSPKLQNSDKNYEEIKHVINLFLEIFGECNILQNNYMSAFKNVKKINWRILPKGEIAFHKINQTIIKMVRGSNDEKVIVKNRIDTITKANPDFVAIGQQGFNGYVIFGFKSKITYILESIYKGNATYIFGDNWEHLSKLSKAEILKGNLQLDRIIHDGNWKEKLKRHL